MPYILGLLTVATTTAKGGYREHIRLKERDAKIAAEAAAEKQAAKKAAEAAAEKQAKEKAEAAAKKMAFARARGLARSQAAKMRKAQRALISEEEDEDI